MQDKTIKKVLNYSDLPQCSKSDDIYYVVSEKKKYRYNGSSYEFVENKKKVQSNAVKKEEKVSKTKKEDKNNNAAKENEKNKVIKDKQD